MLFASICISFNLLPPVDVGAAAPLEDLGKAMSQHRLDEATEFWEAYLQREAEFWEERDSDGPRETLRPYEGNITSLQKNLGYPSSCRQRAEQASRHQRALQLLEWLDQTTMDNTNARPDLFPAGGSLYEAGEKVVECEDQAGARLRQLNQDAPLHLWIGSDKPHSRAVFNPREHVVPGQCVIMNMSDEAGRLQEPCAGIDVARVDKVYDDQVQLDGKRQMDVTYLVPAALRKDGHGAHRTSTVWPIDWVEQKLVPWMTMDSTGTECVAWTEIGVDVDVVLWGCNLTRGTKRGGASIYKVHQRTILAQWQRAIEFARSSAAAFEGGEDAEGDTLDDSEDDDDLLGLAELAQRVQQRRR